MSSLTTTAEIKLFLTVEGNSAWQAVITELGTFSKALNSLGSVSGMKSISEQLANLETQMNGITKSSGTSTAAQEKNMASVATKMAQYNSQAKASTEGRIAAEIAANAAVASAREKAMAAQALGQEELTSTIVKLANSSTAEQEKILAAAAQTTAKIQEGAAGKSELAQAQAAAKIEAVNKGAAEAVARVWQEADKQIASTVEAAAHVRATTPTGFGAAGGLANASATSTAQINATAEAYDRLTKSIGQAGASTRANDAAEQATIGLISNVAKSFNESSVAVSSSTTAMDAHVKAWNQSMNDLQASAQTENNVENAINAKRIKAMNDLQAAAQKENDAENKAAANASANAAAQAKAQAETNSVLTRAIILRQQLVDSYYKLDKSVQMDLDADGQYIKTLMGMNDATLSQDRALNKLTMDMDKAVGVQNSIDTSIKGRITWFEKLNDALFRASFRLSMWGQQLQMAGQRIVQFFSGLVSAFSDFQLTINRAAGALSIWGTTTGGTTVGTGDLTQAVYKLREQMLLIPAADVAKAIYFWGSTTGQVVQTQQDLANVMSEIQPILKLATITQTGYEDALKGVYSILVQYYNGALENTAHVTETLFHITQATAAEFPDLINSFKMVGPVAKANNVSFDDMANLLGRIADLGIRGTMAGRAFRQMFLQLVAPSKIAQAAINDLFNQVSALASAGQGGPGTSMFKGKTYLDLIFPKGQFVGTGAYIHTLAVAVNSLDEQARNAFLKRIGTANEAAATIALVTDEMRKLNGQTAIADKGTLTAAQSADLFNKSWERLTQSVAGAIGALQGAVEVLKLGVGQTIGEALTPFLKTMTSIVHQFSDFLKANPQIVTGLSKLAGGIAALAIAGGGILTLIGSVFGLVGALVVVTNVFGKFVGTGIKVVGVLGAVVEAVIRNWDYIQSRLGTALANLQSAFGSTSGAAQKLGAIADAFLKPLGDAMNFIVMRAADLVLGISELIKAATPLSGIFQALATIIGTLVSISFMKGLVGMVGSLTVGLVRMIPIVGEMVLGTKSHTVALSEEGKALMANVAALNAAGIATAGLDAEQIKTARSTLVLAESQGLAQRAMSGISGAMSKVAALAGPIMFAFVALTTAYDMNILGFKDFVDKIVDGFKSVDQKVAESKQAIQSYIGALGDLGPALAAITSSELNTNLGSALGKVTAAIPTAASVMAGRSDPNSTFYAGGVTAPSAEQVDAGLGTSLIYIDRHGNKVPITGNSSSDALDALQRAISTDYEGLSKDISDAVNHALQTSSDKYSTPINISQLTAGIISARRLSGIGGTAQQDEFITSVVTSVMGGIDPTTITASEIKKKLDAAMGNVSSIGRLFGVQIGAWTGDLSKEIFAQLADTQLAAATSAKQKAYSDSWQAALFKPIQDAANSGLSGTDLQAKINQIYSDAIIHNFDPTKADKATVDAMNAAILNAGVDPSTITNVTQAILGHWTDFWDNIGNLMDQSTALTSKNALDALAAPLQAMNSDIILGINGSMSAFSSAMTIFTDQIAPHAADITGPSGDMLAKLGAFLAQKTGLANPLAAAATVAGPTVTAIGTLADNYITAITGAFDWKKKIADALKKTDNRSMGGTLKEFLSKSLNGALGQWKSLGANMYAQQWLSDLEASVTTAFTTGGPRKKTQMAQLFMNFFDHTDKSKLDPKTVKILDDLRTQAEAILFGDNAQTPTGARPKGWAKEYAKRAAAAGEKMRSENRLLAEQKRAAANSADAVTPNPLAAVGERERALARLTAQTNRLYAQNEALVANMIPMGQSVMDNYTSGLTTAWSTKDQALVLAPADETRAKYVDTTGYYDGGYSIGGAWANGVYQAGIDNKAKIDAAANAAANTYGHSMPTAGPLVNIHEGGKSVGSAWAAGLKKAATKGASDAASSAKNAFSSFDSPSANITSEHEINRVITIKLEASSPDGTVNRTQLSTLRTGLMDAIALSKLGHYAQIG